MKPNNRQKQLAKMIAEHIQSIPNTNDISSPSHWTLNEESAHHIAELYFSFYGNKPEDHNKLFIQLQSCFDSAITAIRQLK